MLVAELTGEEAVLGLVLASGSVLAAGGLLARAAYHRIEERRMHPVAVLNRELARDEAYRFGVSITNSGQGSAFNVRVGVKLDGIEYPLGPGEGNRYTVGPGERVPPEGIIWLKVPPWPYTLERGGPNVDSRAIFYTRYENAFGETWETFNPVDPEASLQVRRSHSTWWRHIAEWRQRVKRKDEQRTAERRRSEPASG
jgi:hypothetical protein